MRATTEAPEPKSKREVETYHHGSLTELLEALCGLNEELEWYNRSPEITISENSFPKGGFSAVIKLDVRPDEWGWHINGENERFDGYPDEGEALDAIDRWLLVNPEDEIVGPYPIYDGKAQEDY